MRKVKCRFWDRETKQYTTAEGLFHQWGCDYEGFEGGPGNYTVGIVELLDGRIIRTEPPNIQFLKEAPDGLAAENR